MASSDNLKEDRIDLAINLIKNATLSNYKIALDTKISQATIGNYKNGKTRPTEANAEIIIKYFSNNTTERSNTTNEAELVTEIITKRVPLVNQYAYAGYLAGYKDQKYIDQLPIIPFDSEDDPNFRYMAFEMKGNSMDDGSRYSYIDGDKLFCQEIPLRMWDTSKLHTMNWNFVIVYKEGIIVRKIIDHDIQNRTIVVHPLNPFINDELINLVDVYQIFHVLEYLRKN